MSDTTDRPGGITSSQTIGPFPHEAWRWAFAPDALAGAVVVSGRVFAGAGAPVADALLEAWAPGADGPLPGLPGLQRVPSGEDGEFRFALPRPQPGAPAAYVTLFARGVLKHQFTAVCLDDGAALLADVPAARRATLIARADGHDAWRWDIHLQGPQETVFFDYA
jgi:protocatechuate 3,4-dioxygenase alpha subunit